MTAGQWLRILSQCLVVVVVFLREWEGGGVGGGVTLPPRDDVK